MPPPTRFSADRILDAALELTREAGIDAVTARNVAARLGCSTGPLFTHFSSMEELHERLMDRVIARFVATAAAVEHEDPMMSAGIGWLGFVVDEPLLYEAVFLKPHPWHAKWGPVRRRMAERMSQHPAYAHLSSEALFALVGRAAIVMHGLGLEIWSGRLPSHGLQRLIEELAVPVVEAAMKRGWVQDLHSAPAPQSQPKESETTA